MLKECVIHNGQVINIGAWDYQIKPVKIGEQEVIIEPEYTDAAGNVIPVVTELQPVFEDQVTNPLPTGAVIERREVTQNADSGWVLAEDYAALRRAVFPTYTPYDILDELLKDANPTPGSKLEQIINERNAVKQQYPKPE